MYGTGKEGEHRDGTKNSGQGVYDLCTTLVRALWHGEGQGACDKCGYGHVVCKV